MYTSIASELGSLKR